MACHGCPHEHDCWPYCKYPTPTWASNGTSGDEPEEIRQMRLAIEQEKRRLRALAAPPTGGE